MHRRVSVNVRPSEPVSAFSGGTQREIFEAYTPWRVYMDAGLFYCRRILDLDSDLAVGRSVLIEAI